MDGDTIQKLVPVPAGWENGGDFYATFDGVDLHVAYGHDAERPRLQFVFNWVRSFRFVSEATYNSDDYDDTRSLLSELPLPHPQNPSDDYYGDRPEAGKGPPRLFRVFHYKAGLIEVVASDWQVEDKALAPSNVGRNG